METQLTAEKKDTPEISEKMHSEYDVADDVAGMKLVFVNVFMIGKQKPGSR
ncbi:MAG: hypothetical protein LH606_20630 [Cytophagaceae bacterium]|nr:hypothetical protein [Cytophagaceae bacterium]